MTRPDEIDGLREFVAEALREAGASVEMDEPGNDVPVDVLRVVVDDWQFDMTFGNVDVVT